MKRLIALSLCIAVIASTMACRHNASSQSGLKHEIGDTFQAEAPLLDCEKMTDEKTGEYSELFDRYEYVKSAKFAKADQYLKKIFEKISSANPDTFKGNLNANNFCLHVGQADEKNATGVPGVGLIVFSDTIIESFDTDADVASVLAHELAHITMNHTPESVHPKLRSNAEYLQMKEAIAEFQNNSPLKSQIDAEIGTAQSLVESIPDYASLVYEDLDIIDKSVIYLIKNPSSTSAVAVEQKRAIDEIRSAFRTIGKEKEITDCLNKLIDLSVQLEKAKIKAGLDMWAKELELLGPEHEEILANWQEQEADEVGYELYLRARFKESDYGKKYRAELSKDRQGVLSCKVSQGTSAGSSLEAIVRGKGSHPSACWRGYDIQILESNTHAADYKVLIPKAIVENFIPGELASVKKSLKRDR